MYKDQLLYSSLKFIKKELTGLVFFSECAENRFPSHKTLGNGRGRGSVCSGLPWPGGKYLMFTRNWRWQENNRTNIKCVGLITVTNCSLLCFWFGLSRNLFPDTGDFTTVGYWGSIYPAKIKQLDKILWRVVKK